MKHVVVVGAGLAGLVTSTALAQSGFGVTCVTFGVGGLPLSPGVVDHRVEGVSVAGGVSGGDASGILSPPCTLGPSYTGAPSDRSGDTPKPPLVENLPPDAPLSEAVPSIRHPARSVAESQDLQSEAETLARSCDFAQDDGTSHPYASIRADTVLRGLELLLELAGPDLLIGDADTNVVLPTAVGAGRPTCLYPPSMVGGASGGPAVIVGFKRLRDFYPELIAGNCGARAAMVDVVARAGEVASSPMVFARFFDTDAGRRALVEALRPVVGDGETVGLPAVLGLDDLTAWRKVEDALEHPVFEIPFAPPSVPGWRLNNALVRAAQAAGVRFVRGVKAVGVEQANGRASGVVVTSAGSPTTLPADAVVLATGGLKSGGIVMDDHQCFTEPVMGLPLANIPDVPFVADVFAPQPAYLVGARVDSAMHPLDDDGNIVCGNVHVVGGLIGGSDRVHELTNGGIDVGSAAAAVDVIEGELR